MLRIVFSPTLQDDIEKLFSAQASKSSFVKKRGAHVGGFGFGFSNLVMFALYGLAFWYGGRLLENGTSNYREFLVAFLSVLFAAIGATEVGCHKKVCLNMYCNQQN